MSINATYKGASFEFAQYDYVYRLYDKLSKSQKEDMDSSGSTKVDVHDTDTGYDYEMRLRRGKSTQQLAYCFLEGSNFAQFRGLKENSKNVCLFLTGAVECQSSKIAYTITVSKSGGANFNTLKNAINSIPCGNNQWIKILIKPGIYKEQIEIQRDKGGCIILEGSDRTTTIITSDNHSSTLASITFASYIDNFVARNVTFKNSFSIGAVDAILRAPAVALGSFGDKHAFYSCGFVGYQDTLWDQKGRHYFKSCYIEGAADFIWGDGQSVYKQCAINVTGGGWITAQGRASGSETSGYVFRSCDVSGIGHADLGRAYNAFARVIFIDSKFSQVVNPEGWFIWNQSGHEKDIIFAEYNCTGPGADTTSRVSWEKKLDSSSVKQFDTQTFINQDGWIAKQPL